MDIHSLLAGVTSERLVEYDFVARNLVSRRNRAKILDIGAAGSGLAHAIGEFGGSGWQLVGIDIIEGGCDVRMDARFAGFADGAFDQIISISTVEHIGLSSGAIDDFGDLKAMQEIFRILDKAGSAIITVPYGKSGATVRQEYRVYDRQALGRLACQFLLAKKEFYRYSSGKWSRCSQRAAEKGEDGYVPAKFHSGVCACLLLRKKGRKPQRHGN
jgi:SAM-dependent methyltransferase